MLDHLQEVVPLGCWAVTRQDEHGQMLVRVCNSDPSPAAKAALEQHGPLLSVFSGLLTSILESDLVISEHLRTVEQAERAAELDPLTGLLNRAGWDRFLEQEEGRHRRFGLSSAVIVAELDRLGEIAEHRGADAADRYVVNAGNALRNTVRGADVVARLGRGEFGVVVLSISTAECELLVDRIHDAFRAAGVTGSVGWAPYTMTGGFTSAMSAAGARVVDDQNQRRSRAGRLVLVR